MVLVLVQEFGTGKRNDLDILQQCHKRVKLKVRRFCGLSPMFVEVTGEKLVGQGGNKVNA